MSTQNKLMELGHLEQNSGENKSSLCLRDLLILALSIYVLAALLIETFLPVNESARALLSAGDTIACVIFIIDFFARFWQAEKKLRFRRWGWIDLLSSIPSVNAVRWGRAVRLFRLIRLMRAARAGGKIIGLFRKSKAEAVGLSALFAAFLTSILSSIAILQVETTPSANIKGPGDALWWTVTTMTTVGYGDRYPTTTEGRLIAVLLMMVGVTLFGVPTALFASWFVAPQSDQLARSRDLEIEIAELRKEVARLRSSAS